MPARPDPERENKLRKLWAQDLTYEVIAQRMGMTKESLRQMGKRLNLPPKPNKARWS